MEKLIGLSRRDIQRACYNGRGGIAILEPKDSSWGKRTYDYEDIAKLFIIKRLRDQGMSLFQTKEQFETFDKESHDYSMLDIQLSLMVSELDALERQIACARALSIATNKKRSSEELDALLYSETLKAIIKRQLNYRTNATFLSI